jgi:hypothetical protein
MDCVSTAVVGRRNRNVRTTGNSRFSDAVIQIGRSVRLPVFLVARVADTKDQYRGIRFRGRVDIEPGHRPYPETGLPRPVRQAGQSWRSIQDSGRPPFFKNTGPSSSAPAARETGYAWRKHVNANPPTPTVSADAVQRPATIAARACAGVTFTGSRSASPYSVSPISGRPKAAG